MKNDLIKLREIYEKPINELIGKSISEVNYYEIDYGHSCWDETEYHSLDYGVEIISNDGECYYFIWGSEFTQYDIKFRKGKILNEFAFENNVIGHLNIDNLKWDKLLNRKIIKIESIWSSWNYLGNKNKNHFPETIKLGFDSGQNLWVSAVEIRDNQVNGMADHLTVFFDKKIVERYNVDNENVV